eukprot:TRINITY_DN2770_c0_g1_i2.p2 TRINITY_DN2770_c0_g1~~TRINITY_DN2770_c0_g1_i2.p2  ORF type:complete len:142 (+),score=43.01 TRINITY_DN2770_c0_g1_i2:222-647(+)
MLIESAKKNNTGLMIRIFDECKSLDVSPKDALGNTPLHYSAQGGHLDTLKMLLERGADTNVQSFTGETPLHKAVVQGNVEIITEILNNGGDPRIANKKKLTPVHLAKSGEVRRQLQRASNTLKDAEKVGDDDDDMFDDDDD